MLLIADYATIERLLITDHDTAVRLLIAVLKLLKLDSDFLFLLSDCGCRVTNYLWRL